ncbi:MAG: hypothetical protein EBT47_14415, partial [Chloroflexi bacterium]|nr:hypothetical protein [Chloroflexota bacterium]
MTDGPAEPTPTSIPAPPGPSKGFGARFLNWFSPQDLQRAPAAVREQVQSRIAAVVLGGIAVVSVATVGGAVLWDQVLYGQQASLKVDGKTITLDEYRAWFSYRQNILLANLQQAEA